MIAPRPQPQPRPQPSITCPDCGMTSYNPNDRRYGYCGSCHAFTSPGEERERERAATLIFIDLNVRLADGATYAGYEDVFGEPPDPGDRVQVTEPESGLRGTATVIRIDPTRRLVYLSVPWDELK